MSRKHKPEEKNMRRRIRLLPSAGFFLVFLAIIAQGLTFYNGPITLSSVDGVYSLSGEPKASITYVFSGNGQVTLDFPGIPSDALILIDGIESSRPAQIMVDGSKSLSIAYTPQILGDASKSATFDPDVSFDGYPNPNRIGTYRFRLDTPYPLSSSSKPAATQPSSFAGSYLWEYSNIYSSLLTFSWNEEGIDIGIDREVPSSIDGDFEVRTKITNKGGKDLEDVALVTSFLPIDFLVKSNPDEFEQITAGNDIRMEWKKSIPLLKAGQTMEFSYTLEINDKEKSAVLRPVGAYVGEEFITESGRLELRDSSFGSSDENKSLQQDIALKDILAQAPLASDAKAILSSESAPQGFFETQGTPQNDPSYPQKPSEAKLEPLADRIKKALAKDGNEEGELKLPTKFSALEYLLAFLIASAILFALFKYLIFPAPERELLAFIMNSLQKGYGKESIRAHLRSKGISSRKIERHFTHIEKGKGL